jgi:hypothetical protein
VIAGSLLDAFLLVGEGVLVFNVTVVVIFVLDHLAGRTFRFLRSPSAGTTAPGDGGAAGNSARSGRLPVDAAPSASGSERDQAELDNEEGGRR